MTRLYEAEIEGEISVAKGEIIGLIENNPNDKMCKVNYFADVIV